MYVVIAFTQQEQNLITIKLYLSSHGNRQYCKVPISTSIQDLQLSYELAVSNVELNLIAIRMFCGISEYKSNYLSCTRLRLCRLYHSAPGIVVGAIPPKHCLQLHLCQQIREIAILLLSALHHYMFPSLRRSQPMVFTHFVQCSLFLLARHSVCNSLQFFQ